MFKKSNGYIQTQLLNDKENLYRFITIDFWKSKEDLESFREKYAKDMKLLVLSVWILLRRKDFLGILNRDLLNKN